MTQFQFLKSYCVHSFKPEPGMSVTTLKGPLPDSCYRLTTSANQKASL